VYRLLGGNHLKIALALSNDDGTYQALATFVLAFTFVLGNDYVLVAILNP
jgi:hypothetical protein